MTAREWLDAVQVRADAATCGPWTAYGQAIGAFVGHGGCGGCSGVLGITHEPACGSEQIAHTDDPAVAEFIAAARTDLPLAIAALRAVLDLHKAGDGPSQGYTGSGYGYIDPYCAGCEASDEYAVEWPCPTVLAITAALDPAAGREQIGETP